jgi:hypothetical protein
MILKLLRNPRVIEFLYYAASIPAAWFIGNYGASWVTYVEGSSELLYLLYVGALFLLMVGMTSPIALAPKRWQLLVGAPIVIGVLTVSLPYFKELKVMADARFIQATTDASDKLIAI